MDPDELRAAGWEEIAPLTADVARRFGLPDGQRAYHKLVSDGSLVAVLTHDTNGHAFALSHVAHFTPEVVVPGRLPTYAELYAVRRVLIPNHTVLMVAVLEPMSFALRLRWERVNVPSLLPQAPGLPTTVKCVQMYCEGVTEDCVFGTQDIPSPTPVPPAGYGVDVYTARDPVGPVPDELLGDAEAALDGMADDDDEGRDF